MCSVIFKAIFKFCGTILFIYINIYYLPPEIKMTILTVFYFTFFNRHTWLNAYTILLFAKYYLKIRARHANNEEDSFFLPAKRFLGIRIDSFKINILSVLFNCIFRPLIAVSFYVKIFHAVIPRNSRWSSHTVEFSNAGGFELKRFTFLINSKASFFVKCHYPSGRIC